MRHGSFQGRRNNNQGRHRGPSSGPRPTNNGSQRPHRNQVLDSNGPEMRVRGTAHQINEKYQALAKDAASSGDIILAENYLQHAEHYQRMINEFEPQQQQQQPRYENESGGGQPSAEAEGEQPAVHVVRPKRGPQPEGSDEGDLGLPSTLFAGPEAANAG